jgi:hypothetical protein
LGPQNTDCEQAPRKGEVDAYLVDALSLQRSVLHSTTPQLWKAFFVFTLTRTRHAAPLYRRLDRRGIRAKRAHCSSCSHRQSVSAAGTALPARPVRNAVFDRSGSVFMVVVGILGHPTAWQHHFSATNHERRCWRLSLNWSYAAANCRDVATLLPNGVASIRDCLAVPTAVGPMTKAIPRAFFPRPPLSRRRRRGRLAANSALS